MQHILKNAETSALISLQGGTVVNWSHGKIPIFRPYSDVEGIFAERCGCFPLVPFGNRMENNQILVGGLPYFFKPNTKDPYYLHGDGWLAQWSWVTRNEDTASMELSWRGPFSYRCRQDFILTQNSLALKLSLTNTGPSSMLCGLGWHPYFSFPKRFSLHAHCTHFWTEDENHLPLHKKKCTSGRGGDVKKIWENTCSEGWDGRAQIETETYKLCLTTEPALHYFQTFTMGGANFYCFEPMGHRTNDFHEEAGFRLLEAGQDCSQSITMTLI